MKKTVAAAKAVLYTKYIEVAFLLAIGAWAAWGVAGVHFAQKLICPDASDCAAYGQIGDIFGGINALFAALGFVGLAISIESARRSAEDERARNRDRELLDQVTKSYSWAHEAFMKNANEGLVKADRMNWITTARHLLRAKRLALQIQSDTYQTIQQELEEYWRTRFYSAVDNTRLMSADFFFEDADKDKPVDLSSAIVVADFIAWREDEVDPLEEVDIHATMLKKNFMSSRLARGIEKYVVVHLPGLAQEHKRRMDKKNPIE